MDEKQDNMKKEKTSELEKQVFRRFPKWRKDFSRSGFRRILNFVIENVVLTGLVENHNSIKNYGSHLNQLFLQITGKDDVFEIEGYHFPYNPKSREKGYLEISVGFPDLNISYEEYSTLQWILREAGFRSF
ncbi:MAG: hypothetical protein KKG60_01425 [Nanoarchaeota archaeon]|nr:hypothetical protein [Nanoarchaeota archaeon]